MRWAQAVALTPALLVLTLGAAPGCRQPPASEDGEAGAPAGAKQAPSEPPKAEAEDAAETTTGGEDDPLRGEAAHVIPFADRTSMGYLLLLPAGTKEPEAPTRELLRTLVEQAFPERRGAGEFDLLLTLIATEPHTTDLALGAVEVPKVGELGAEDEDEDEDGGEEQALVDPGEVEDEVARLERERSFDLIGLHIELIRLGVGDSATIPTSAFEDPVLTRELDAEQRASLPGRQWALLLRADYRNQHAVRGLRLHQTLVRVAAEHYQALIHDPDTLETLDVEAFTERRLRAAAGNVADQIAIVPFPDANDPEALRLSTRGMRRFGSVDIELDGLPRDPAVLQQASDLIAGLGLVLTQEAVVDVSGFAVEVPEVLEVRCEDLRQSYATRGYEPACSGSVLLHLVERAPEGHDPRDHVVARVVAPRPESDDPAYDHRAWVRAALGALFPTKPGAAPGR